MSTANRKQHTVPAFYLRGFAWPRRGPLQVLDLATGGWEEKMPKEISRELDFYTTDGPDSEDDLSIETEFNKKIEDWAAPVVRAIRLREFLLAKDSLGYLLPFIASLWVRRRQPVRR